MLGKMLGKTRCLARQNAWQEWGVRVKLLNGGYQLMEGGWGEEGSSVIGRGVGWRVKIVCPLWLFIASQFPHFIILPNVMMEQKREGLAKN